MKLVDLDPRWCSESTDRHGMGISFDCPHCVAAKVPVDAIFTIFVPFSNPLDGKPAFKDHRVLWQRTGDTFETLTLAPSVDASRTHPGGWHGHVQGGELK